MTRLVLDNKSECVTPPIEISSHVAGGDVGCWHPATFDKAVVIVIDALRYDFTIPFSGDARHYHNALSVLHETAVRTPQQAFLLPFIADPPTATLQRLKGLTTGTLPTFIDVGSSFTGTAIEEDNLLVQLRDAGKTLVHLGDDTWHSLFPGYFNENLTHAYDSFNVWDLHTVDNGVNEHLFPLLSKPQSSRWDVIFGHYLGVDHAGHRYGPDHPAMNAKLKQMDKVLRDIIKAIDDDTLLVIMGDHGMDVKGDHGGESDDEVEAALWMYSKKGVFGRTEEASVQPPSTAKERPVAQIDLVPTLALLLGLPIPFNNLGTPISEAFAKGPEADWRSLATVNALSAAQIDRYQTHYSKARGLSSDTFTRAQKLKETTHEDWQDALAGRKRLQFEKAFRSAFDYQREVLRVCRSLWARFHIPSMLLGIGVLIAATFAISIFARSKIIDVGAVPDYLRRIGSFGILGTMLGIVVTGPGSPSQFINHALLGYIAGSTLGFTLGLFAPFARWLRLGITTILPRSLWSWLSILMTVLPAAGFASNSYTIWEDEILLFLLSSFGVLTLVVSMRRPSAIDRLFGCSQSIFFVFLARLASLSRLCREEQMPFCRSTYYASTSSSTSSPWQLTLPLLVAINLPFIIKWYYRSTGSYHGSAIFWIGGAFRMSLVGVAFFWLLDTADDGDWFSNISKSSLKLTRSILARIILGTALAAGTTTYYYAKPCIKVLIPAAENGVADGEAIEKPKQLRVFGYSNMHGARYLLLVSNFVIVVALVQKPMGIGAVGVMISQVLALLEILNINGLTTTAIGPVVLGLMGNYFFFKTGHQATPASIQWESAFIPLATMKYPWSPLLVLVNTFGAQILATLAVPLLALWNKPPTQKNLLSGVVKHLATTILFHATINLATTMWAGHLRRHLMLYRVFSPRFMMGAITLIIVDLVGIFIAMVGVRINFINVAEVFGWR